MHVPRILRPVLLAVAGAGLATGVVLAAMDWHEAVSGKAVTLTALALGLFVVACWSPSPATAPAPCQHGTLYRGDVVSARQGDTVPLGPLRRPAAPSADGSLRLAQRYEVLSVEAARMEGYAQGYVDGIARREEGDR